MSVATRLRYLHLAYFSKPVADRTIYRTIRRERPRSIVEIGIGSAVRAGRMLSAAAQYRPQERIRYTGIDLFEAGDTGLSLKSAYRDLMACGGRVQLEPGDPFSALSRTANNLMETDLLVIGLGQDEQSLAKAWFYVPRMLSEQAKVFVQRTGDDPATATFDLLSSTDVQQLAASTDTYSQRRAA